MNIKYSCYNSFRPNYFSLKFKFSQKVIAGRILLKNCFISNYFVDDTVWKRKLYRLIDSYEGEEAIQLRAIESEIFEAIKEEIANDYGGSWTGCNIQNRAADAKVASSIKSSFRAYEKQGLKPYGHFFKF